MKLETVPDKITKRELNRNFERIEDFITDLQIRLEKLEESK